MVEHEGPLPSQGESEQRKPASSEAVGELRDRILEAQRTAYSGESGYAYLYDPGSGHYYDINSFQRGSLSFAPEIVMDIDEMTVAGLDHEGGTYQITRYFILEDNEGVLQAVQVPLKSKIGETPKLRIQDFQDYRDSGKGVVTEREVDQLQFHFMKAQPVEPEQMPFY